MSERRFVVMNPSASSFQRRFTPLMLILTCGLSLAVPTAEAAIVEFTVTGEVTAYADLGIEPWTGLSAGDPLLMRFSYDAATPATSSGSWSSLFEDVVFKSSLTIGTASESFASADIQLLHGEPVFDNFVRDGFEFLPAAMPSGVLASFFLSRGYLAGGESIFAPGQLPSSLDVKDFDGSSFVLTRVKGMITQPFLNAEILTIESVVVPSPATCCMLGALVASLRRRKRFGGHES